MFKQYIFQCKSCSLYQGTVDRLFISVTDYQHSEPLELFTFQIRTSNEFRQNFKVDAMTKQQVESQLSRLLVQLHLLGSPTNYQSRGAKYSLQMQTVSRSTYLDLQDTWGCDKMIPMSSPNNVLTHEVDCRFFSILVTVQQNMILQKEM
jgi:hypothetical protein